MSAYGLSCVLSYLSLRFKIGVDPTVVSLAAISITAMPAGRHVQIVPVWMRPTDVSDDGWHTTAVSPAGGQLPDRTASISPSHVLVMSALTLRTRRHPTRCRPPDIWKADAQRGVSRRGAASSRSVRVDGWVRTLWGTHLRKTIFQPTQNPRCQMQPLRQIQTALD